MANVVDVTSPEFEARLAEARRRRLAAEENPTFEDLKELWPSNMRGNLSVARKKYEQITGDGLRTQVFDKDANRYEEIFLKATPREVYQGAVAYLKSMRGSSFALSPYTKRLQNFLNGGYWQQ